MAHGLRLAILASSGLSATVEAGVEAREPDKFLAQTQEVEEEEAAQWRGLVILPPLYPLLLM